MEKQHPLKFFIDFVEKKPLKAWEEEFYDGAIPDFDTPERRKKGYIVSLKRNSEGGESEFDLYFRDVLTSRFLEEKSQAIQALEKELMSMSDMNSLKVKITVLSASMASLLDKVNLYKETMSYPFILETYTQLQAELNNKAQQMGLGTKPVATQAGKPDGVNKLQWLGQLKVLGTLFYHLLKGQDRGTPYIAGSVEQVKRMLLDNFVDSEGHELSKSSLDTIFAPGRSEKRANEGDRIELPNKRVKN